MGLNLVRVQFINNFIGKTVHIHVFNITKHYKLVLLDIGDKMLCTTHIYIAQSFKIPAKYNYHYTFNKILLIYALADWRLLTINSMEISPADYSAARCY